MSATSDQVNLQSVKQNSMRGWASWIIVALFFFLDYCLKNSIGALGSTLIHDYNMTHTQFSQISAAFPLAYLFLQIPAGILVDKYGPRWVITSAAAICGIGCLLFANVYSYHCMLIGRALIGAGAAFSLVTCSKIAAIWFDPRRFAFLFGIMIMIAFTGAFIGMRTVVPIIDTLGWKNAMFMASAICLILSFIMATIIRDTVDNSPYKMENNQSIMDLTKEILMVMTSKQAWLLALFAGLMFVPTTVIATWGPQVLSDKFNIDEKITPQLTSWLFMGWIVGSPISGYISDYLGRRKPVMMLSAVTTFIFSSILVFSTTLSEKAMMNLIFIVGVCSSGFALSFTVLKESYSNDLVGAAMGFMNSMNTLFEWGSIIIAGYTVALYSNYLALPIGQSALEASFYIIPVSLLLSIIITPMVNEKR